MPNSNRQDVIIHDSYEMGAGYQSVNEVTLPPSLRDIPGAIRSAIAAAFGRSEIPPESHITLNINITVPVLYASGGGATVNYTQKVTNA